MKRFLAALAVAVTLTLVTGTAWSYWTTSSVAGGSGAAAATSVNQGATPTVSAIGSNVTVSWAASTLATGQPVAGYLVKRYDAVTTAAQTVLSACVGTIATTSCTESNVPTGLWTYTVTPVFGSNWQGAESAKSLTLTLNIDIIPPTNAISLAPVTGGAYLGGSTVYYRGVAAGTLRLSNAVSDAGSGPASSATAVLAGTTTGWTHVPSTVSAPAGGPYVSNAFSWTAGTTSSPTEAVTGRDLVGLTAVSALTFVNDSTPPTVGTITYAAGLATGRSVSVSFTTGTDSGSGIGTRQLQRATAVLSNNTCGTFGAFADVGPDGPTSPYVDGGLGADCYQYRYVVTDRVGNQQIATSTNVAKVDGDPPAAPSLTFTALTSTWWPGSGSLVYYRSAAGSGSVRVTATATAPSGIASYTFPALGAGWTSTAGATGVTTYSWSAASPAAPGTKSVTATNNAGVVSTPAPFTLTADDAAPTGDSLSYTNGVTTSTSVAISMTTGTDAGSGIGTRLLQRASATLSGTTCGTFGAFATVTGGTNPTSPKTDTVTRGSCYQYRYLVADNLGNQDVATSTSVVKVLPTYVDAVSATAGLVNYFRLDESTTTADSMTGAAGAALQSRTGEIGASWSLIQIGDAGAVLTPGGRVRKAGNSDGTVYTPSGTLTSPDYTVEADVYVASNLANDQLGIWGRGSPATISAYYVRYEQPTQRWVLYKVQNSQLTALGQSAVQPLTVGSTYRLSLDLSGTRIRALVDGVQMVSVTDGSITGTGLAGFALGFGPAATNVTDSTGLQLDNFRISPSVSDGFGTNDGSWFSAILRSAGAIVGDADTAATFDGTRGFGTVARQVSDDFSIELWFKSTQGIGTGTSWQQGAGLVDANSSATANDFGVSLRSDGKVVAGVGNPDTSVVSTLGGYDDGVWHHVVFTRVRTSGALALYVDGLAAGTATSANRASLTSTANLSFGRLESGGNYLQGSLDEIAIYNTALPAATVATHYTIGTTP